MDSKAVDDFVQCLLKGLCLKFSQKEDDTPANNFCVELLDFSRQLENRILGDIYKIPAEILTREDTFVRFLNSVCSDICNKLIDCDERKFFLLCGFIMNFVTLSFTIPCHRLLKNAAPVLASHLEQSLRLNLDSEVRVAFEHLEGKGPQLTKDRLWICRRLTQLRGFILKAEKECAVDANQPIFASHLKNLQDLGISQTSNGYSSEIETCLFCSRNCKAFVETFLN